MTPLLLGCAAMVIVRAQGPGAWDWMIVGFPTERYVAWSMGAVANLPALLGDVYGIDVRMPIEWPWVTALTGAPVEVRVLMRWIVLGLLALSGAAAGWSMRRRSVGVLAWVALPWALIYTLLPQMHERYAMFAAVGGVMLVGMGLGGTLVYAGFTLLATAATLIVMLAASGTPEPWGIYWDVLRPLFPHAGWATLVLCVCIVSMALRADWGGRRVGLRTRNFMTNDTPNR